jgi:hypothetical protein
MQGYPNDFGVLMRDQFTAPFSILESVGARIIEKAIASHNAAVATLCKVVDVGWSELIFVVITIPD